MPEEKTEQKQDDSKKQPEEQKDTIQEKTYTLSEDYEALKKINLVRDLSIVIQFGKHPNKEINELIKRRFSLNQDDFKGDLVLRIFISMFSVFFIGIAIWLGSWLICASLSLIWLAKAISAILSFLTLSGMIASVFYPYPVIEENKLTAYISNEMLKLNEKLKEEERFIHKQKDEQQK